MLPNSTRCVYLTGFTDLNWLQWLNRLGAGSVIVVSTIGGSGISPACAHSLDTSALPSEPSRVELPTDGGELALQEREAAFTNEQHVIEQPTAVSVEDTAVGLPTTEIAASPSRGQTDNESEKPAQLALSSTVVEPSYPSVGDRSSDSPTFSVEEGDEAGATSSLPSSAETSVASSYRSNTTLVQLPSPQAPSILPVPSTPIPATNKKSNLTVGQIPSLPQPPNFPPMGGQMSPTPYSPGVAQSPYYPQVMLLVPVPATGMPMSPTPYNPGAVQSPYYPQVMLLVPVPATGMPMSPTPYNPGVAQSPYYLQPAPPFNPGPVGSNNYSPGVAQSPYYLQPVPPQSLAPGMIPVGTANYYPQAQPPYYPQSAPALPAPLNPSAVGTTSYYPQGQYAYPTQGAPPLSAPLNPSAVGTTSYYPQGQYVYPTQGAPPLPPPLNPSAVGTTSYNPQGQYVYPTQGAPPLPLPLNPSAVGTTSYYPQGQYAYPTQGMPPLPAPLNPSAVGTTNYNPTLGQYPYPPQTPPPASSTPNPNLVPSVSSPPAAPPPPQQPSPLRSKPVTSPALSFQGGYILEGSDSAARARLTGIYPVNSQLQFGGSIDLTSGDRIFADSETQGLNINELYVATAPFRDVPNLRLVAGQLDLTSYFDRNSFAKDALTHFFNPVFQTNPALSATGVSSRPGALLNWTITDNIEAKAAIFSSARDVGDFTLNGFAGEIGIRYGNAIIRGTYASNRDAGTDSGFQEIFSVRRSDGGTGIRSSDREQAYGVNVEYFIPKINMGLFARYGRYNNQALDLGGDTYSLGINFLDVLTKDDRLGLGYGRALSNERLRQERGDELPDVLELFYDFRFLPNVRLGFTLQERNNFSETYGGFRIKTEFDVTPRGGSTQ
jgi:hypothetical protein